MTHNKTVSIFYGVTYYYVIASNNGIGFVTARKTFEGYNKINFDNDILLYYFIPGASAQTNDDIRSSLVDKFSRRVMRFSDDADYDRILMCCDSDTYIFYTLYV